MTAREGETYESDQLAYVGTQIGKSFDGYIDPPENQLTGAHKMVGQLTISGTWVSWIAWGGYDATGAWYTGAGVLDLTTISEYYDQPTS